MLNQIAFCTSATEGFGWLVLIAALNSVVSLFYYFSVAKSLFLSDPSDDKPALSQPLFAGPIAALGILTIYFGLAPDSIQELVNLCSLLG